MKSNAILRLPAMLIALCLFAGHLAPARAADDQIAIDPYMRVFRPIDSVSMLQIASKQFDSGRIDAPTVWLVGVVHIGDTAYYEALQKLLDEHDLVLYEGVGAPGFASRDKPSAKQKVKRTREAIAFVTGSIADYRKRETAPPESLAALVEEMKRSNPKTGRWLRHAIVDGWGRPLVYQVDGDGYTLKSLGSDGKPGGKRRAADIDAADVTPYRIDSPEEGGIQSSLARGLGLAFQLDAIDYDRANFRSCDMSARQLRAAVKGEPIKDDDAHDRDADRTGDQSDADDAGNDDADDANNADAGGASKQMKLIEKLMDGQSMEAGAVRFFATILEAQPRWAELIKLMMVEMLGELKGDLAQSANLPPDIQELMAVLVHRRNDIVIRAIQDASTADAPPGSIAVFYGAGHMDDLERRLRTELGYEPAGEKWHTAFHANTRKAGLSDREVEQFREMIRQQMEQLQNR